MKSRHAENAGGEQPDSPTEPKSSNVSERDKRRKDRAELRARRDKRKAKRAGKDDQRSGSKALLPSVDIVDGGTASSLSQQQPRRRRHGGRVKRTPSDVSHSGTPRRQKSETAAQSTNDKKPERDVKRSKRTAQRRKRRQPETPPSPDEAKATYRADAESGKATVDPSENDEDQADAFSAEDDLEEVERAEGGAGRGRNARIYRVRHPQRLSPAISVKRCCCLGRSGMLLKSGE